MVGVEIVFGGELVLDYVFGVCFCIGFVVV